MQEAVAQCLHDCRRRLQGWIVVATLYIRCDFGADIELLLWQKSMDALSYHDRLFGLGFLPFQEHANAHTVLLEEVTQATEHLSLLYEIIQEHFITLRQAGVSTWGVCWAV